MSLAPAKLPVKQPAFNAQGHSHDVRDPVVYVGAPVEAGLYEFNDPAEGARADEDRQQAYAALRASGKTSAAKAMKCTSLSLPSGAGGGASRGQSIATLRVSVTAMVRGMSRYLRMQNAYRRWVQNARQSYHLLDSHLRRKSRLIRGLGVPISFLLRN